MRRLALALLLAAPLALAHGPPAAFDPLVVELHTYLTADLLATEAPPEPGGIAFPPAAPASAPTPLRFTLSAPSRFSAAGFDVELTLRADSLVPTRDADGDSFEIDIEPGGEPVRVALEDPVLAPGTLATVSARVTAPGVTYAAGEPIALTILPLMPGLTQGALSLVVGGDAPSRLDARDMRIPSVADLALQDEPRVAFLLANETFGGPAHALLVGHDATRLVSQQNATYVVLRGEEEDPDASTHAFPDRERRIAAAHVYTVNGMRVRVHPGIGTVVTVPATATIRILCEANCPPGGYAQTIAPGTGNAPAGEDRPSVLVPPPRDTRGIPVSEDEKPRETPGMPIAILAGAGIAACGRKKGGARSAKGKGNGDRAMGKRSP